MVTDLDGRITQNVVYIPYGEVFVEERNGSWASPYLFNAKELDEETGLYYYGARYLNPSIALWLSTDPLQGKYPGMSPYNYCAGNPVKMVDPDGEASKPSEVIKSFGFEISPLGAGVLDGLLEASPIGLATFTYDVATDEKFRSELCEGLKFLAENPTEAISTFVESKADTYSAVFQGTATDEQKYEVGCDIGNTIGALLTGACAKSLISKFKALSNEDIVQKAANMAEKNIGGDGPVQGTKKHIYAEKLISRYQKTYGDRGLKVNEYFKAGKVKGYLDVHDTKNNVIYDFKFGGAKMRKAQYNKYHNRFPNDEIKIVRPKKNHERGNDFKK